MSWSCGRGGIGIRARLRGVWETVRVQVPSTAPALHVSFDTKLACSFLLFEYKDYAEINLFAVNMAHFYIIHLLPCKSDLRFHLSYPSSHPVFNPISDPSRSRCGLLPVSVDKC